MELKELNIGNIVIKYPIIQGGMGVGISRGKLAGAVSANGGLGVISTAQIGYDEPGFEKDQNKANLSAIRKHILMAKEISGGKPVGVNIMVALKNYKAHVKAAIEAGADIIISGAGLPVHLPEYASGSACKIAPIVSSAKAAKVILQNWLKKAGRIADFIVVEGPKAGGHLGFKKDQVDSITNEEYDSEIKQIIETVKEFEDKSSTKIPVIVAGGIFNHNDICHAMSLGASGVQIASRFVATDECDADIKYKQAYINAEDKDVIIIDSPVGMPGRAIRNKFTDYIKDNRIKPGKCFNCLEKCNPAEVPYCITKALTDAVCGDTENGLVFAGANVGRIKHIVPVHELIEELADVRQV